MRVFYHADRKGQLSPGLDLQVDARGLSRFGQVYWDRLRSTPVDQMDSALLREYYAEQALHQTGFFWSRHACIFAAESVEEAIDFARFVEPPPEKPVPIYEISTSGNCSRHDMNWLDFNVDPETSLAYARNYWHMLETNHQPATGTRSPPRWEILIPLPARVGTQVATALV